MTKLTKTRAAQRPLVAEFEFAIGDTMLNADGVENHPINSVSGAAFDIFDLPPGSEVIGGDVVVAEAVNSTGEATIAIGDKAVPDRYLAASTVKAEGRKALVPTGYVNTGGLALRMTLALADAAATAGKVRVRVMYTIAGRANEVV